jgi:hypothetical protein
LASMKTLEIKLVYLWFRGHHRNVLDVSKYLCGSVSLSVSEVRLIGWLDCCGPW